MSVPGDLVSTQVPMAVFTLIYSLISSPTASDREAGRRGIDFVTFPSKTVIKNLKNSTPSEKDLYILWNLKGLLITAHSLLAWGCSTSCNSNVI